MLRGPGPTTAIIRTAMRNRIAHPSEAKVKLSGVPDYSGYSTHEGAESAVKAQELRVRSSAFGLYDWDQL
jgi:hypothetical protein